MSVLSKMWGEDQWDMPGWMREGGKGLWEQYGADSRQAYGPEAYERNVSRYRENYDKNMRNQQAASGGNLANRGFRYGGTPLFQQQAAGDMARFQSDEQARLMQERLRAYLEQMGMLTGMQGMYSKHYAPGAGIAIGQMAAMGQDYAKMAASGTGG